MGKIAKTNEKMRSHFLKQIIIKVSQFIHKIFHGLIVSKKQEHN